MEVDPYRTGSRHAVEAGQLEDKVVEASGRLEAESRHHFHGGGIGRLDEPGEIGGALPVRPAFGGLDQGRPQPSPLQAGLDAGIKGVAGRAALAVHPDVRQRQALDPDNRPFPLGDQYLGDRVRIGAGEEVRAGLEELGAGMGRGPFQGKQGRVVVLSRLAKDGPR